MAKLAAEDKRIDNKVDTVKTQVEQGFGTIAKSFGGGAFVDADGNLIAPEYIFGSNKFDNVGDSLKYLDKKIANSSGLFQVDGDQIVIAENEETEKIKVVNIGDRVMTGVANGDISKDSTDAVNGGQLYAVEQQVDYNTRNIAHINNSLAHYDNRIKNVEKRVQENRKVSSAGIAGAMAMGSIPYVDHAKYSFGMGMATFDGESAISMGLTWKFNGDSARFRINGSYDSQNKLGVGVGVAFEL